MSGKQPSKTGKKGFSVAPSPFNGVKLELALILLMAAVFWLLVGRLSDSAATQTVLLFGFGVVAMVWLVLRTRFILKQQLQQQTPEKVHTPEQSSTETAN